MDSLQVSPAVSGVGPSLHRSLSDLHRVQRRAIRTRFPLAPLAAPRAEMLRLVRQHDRISLDEAADLLALHPSAVSTVVDDLVHEGFLVRVNDFDDRSVLRLRLASKGRARLGAWRDQGGHILDDALACLSERERTQLVRALPALAHLADALEHLE
jgi:DNA-binding MarR family transcriptional regulator